MLSRIRITSIAFRGVPCARNKTYSSISSKINVCNSYLNENNPEFDIRKSDSNTNLSTEMPSISDEKENAYFIENGLRKVYPYKFRHSTYCKGRWFKKTLIDVYTKEFSLFPREELEKRILTGILRVNGEVVDLTYKLKNSDIVTSTVHRHELPVLAASIKTVYEDDNFLVIDKPPSIPVHPCGLYRNNTVIFILEQEQNKKGLHVIHRLDRLTSGVLIFAKSPEKSREIHEDMTVRNVKKEYLCRVEGEFPDGVIVCNKPLKQVRYKVGISLVDPKGKIAITEFQKLSFNGKSSVVRCKPYTGRIHQIRVHLQYLGYPILNDPLYNSYVFGAEKGKHGILHKNINQLLDDLIREHCTEWWLDNETEPLCENTEIDTNIANLVFNLKCYDMVKHLNAKDPSRLTFDKDCYFCRLAFRDPKPSNLFMFLHAYKYGNDKWEFQTKIPLWADDSWNIM